MYKKIISLLIAVILMFSAVPSIIADNGTTLYVATTGNDSAAGTESAPLKTLQGARDKIRELKTAGATVKEVVFSGGDYYMSKVTFDDQDSGTEAQPITYRAATGEKVRFKGSVKLDMSKATKVTNAAALQRIQHTVVNDIIQINLAEQGINQRSINLPYVSENPETAKINSAATGGYGGYNSIFVDGYENSIAQWPNGRDYAYWKESVKNDAGRATGFVYTDSAPERWTSADIVTWWIGAYPDYDFRYITVSPKELNTQDNKIMVLDDVQSPLSNPFSKRWKAFNLLEELDVPGEYYIDRENMMLYMYPEYDLTNSTVELNLMSQSGSYSSLIEADGLKNVTFEGIEFSQAIKDGVVMYEVDNVDFIDCSFTNISGTAIQNFNLYDMRGKDDKATIPTTARDYWMTQSHIRNDRSYNVDITGCEFYNIGYEALRLLGGNVDTLTPSNNIVSDCLFFNINTRYLSSAVVISGCGNTFKNNVVSRTGKEAITIYGNNHTIQGNEIYDAMREAGDGGAIYQGRSQLHRGTTITENYIHYLQPADDAFTSGTVGIYSDDGQHGNIITKNIIVDAKTGYNSHAAASMEFTDNIIVGGTTPWNFIDWSQQEKEHKFTGMVNYDSNPDLVMFAGSARYATFDDLINSIYDKDLYFTTYPNLKRWVEEDIHQKSLSVNSGNLAVGYAKPVAGAQEIANATWSRTEGVTDDNNVIAATAEFVDAANQDYRLRSDCYLAKKMPNLLNNSNFDINNIGIKSKTITLNAQTAPFKITYPKIDAVVSRANLKLMWREAFGANDYYVEISDSADFSNITWSGTSRYNHINVPKSELSQGATYYWRVTAVNVSRAQNARWTCDTATGRFTVGD